MILILILSILLIEYTLKPRLDYTRDKKLLLWYNSNGGREYYEIL